MGRVFVFEPGNNNLMYLKKNVTYFPNIRVIEQAISDRKGEAKFYEEDFTGQNNSLLSNYGRLNTNARNAYVSASKEEVTVITNTLDDFCCDTDIKPDFIKIDIEGAELMALRGMTDVLSKYSPIMMVEITENFKQVMTIIEQNNFGVYDESLAQLNVDSSYLGNVFCFHNEHHKEIFSKAMKANKVQ
jgi:FkbM family methyltransferase